MGRKKNETRDAARVGAGERIPTEEERREEDHGSERGTQREREREKKRGCSLGERAIIARNIIPG